jgi:hypothetical protein
MKRNRSLALAIAALAIAPIAFGADVSVLGVTVGSEASFTAVDGNTSLYKADTAFGAYTGTTNFTYKIRTTLVGGSGSITVLVTEFSGTGGPAVADLTYTCSAPAPGSPCPSSTAASTSTASSVVSFGADAHSADTGDAGATVWTLVDQPQMKTGNYTVTATYTISAA